MGKRFNRVQRFFRHSKERADGPASIDSAEIPVFSGGTVRSDKIARANRHAHVSVGVMWP
jgi:hypothetical protein